MTQDETRDEKIKRLKEEFLMEHGNMGRHAMDTAEEWLLTMDAMGILVRGEKVSEMHHVAREREILEFRRLAAAMVGRREYVG